MSLRRGRVRAELNADINVVSLIDVMMLLLVIFMITAPIMQGGIDVQLPTAESKPLEPKNGVFITVSRDRIFVNETPYTNREFRSALRTIAKNAKDGVYFRGDAGISYQRLMEIIGIAVSAGVTNIGLVTLPPDAPGR
jgi:biopolymer transport protein ExbD